MSCTSFRSSLCVATCLAALCTGTAAWAQNSSASVETVTVTGSLENEIPQLLSQTGIQVNTISQTAIKNGNYVDVSQSLQFQAPALYISSKNGPFDYVDVSFQGSRTSDVLWLVDGIRINNRLYAGTTPLDTLPASMVDHIEIIQGGQALFYGTEAAAGAINIITKDFSATPDGALTIGADSNTGRHVDGYFRDTLGKNEFVIYGSADQSNGYRPFPKADYQPSDTDHNRGYRVFTMGAKYGYNLADDLRMSAAFEHNDAKLDYAYTQLVATAFNERNESLLSYKVDYTPSDIVQLYVKGYYHWWDSHFTEFDNVIGSPGTLTVIDNHDYWGFEDRGVNAMAKVRLMPGLDSIVGYDLQNYSGRDAVLLIEPQTETVHAIFGQLRMLDLIPRADLGFGFRYNMPSIGQSAFVWNASGQYNVTDHFYLKGEVGTSFRLPSAEELFANDPNDELGNPNLKPESSLDAAASIGGDVQVGVPVSWRITGFHRRIKNLIDYETFNAVTNQDVFGNVPGDVTTQGFEVMLTAPLSMDLSGNADFTYSQSRESGSDLQFKRIPETLFKAGLDYHPMNIPFGASAELEHVGNLYDTVSGGVGRVGYGNYTILNIGARVFLGAMRQNRLGVNLDNVFDTAYASHLVRATADATGASYLAHDRGLPRTVYLTYTYSFQ